MPHLYLVDGSSYIFRAYHRLPPLTNRHGLNVGAVYGYTTMLWKLAESLHKADGPTHLAVIFDKGSHTFRNEMYDQYKAHRPPPPPDLVPQFPLIRDATRAFSLPCIEEEGLEADDIIACYAKAALAQDWKVTIVSSDKDLMQLIEPNLDLYDTMNERRIDRDYVVEKFGVGPEQLGEVLALMGDSVDNVPGVPGVGPKTAALLIQEYGDVEGVLAHVDEIKKPKLKQNLAEHADVTLRLWKRFKARLPHERVTRIYEMVDRPLVPVVARMELEGVKVDRQELNNLSREFSEQILKLEEKICGEAGCTFTIGSPQQLGDVLFNQMGLKGGRKGKSGTWSTDVTELERLSREGVPIAALVLEWRQLSKLKSTYTDALQQQINKETGRVHTSYSLSGAQTGRLSSTDPNLQNIPIRTEIGRKIRDAFVAEPGNVLMSADYSQIELRLAAHMADVPQLKAAFAAGADIHSMTAQELFGKVDRDTRASAKTINFAILYGISRWGLAGRLSTTADEAQAIIDRYFERFPGIGNYIADTLHKARETGFTTTLFGRKTHFPGLKSKVQHERQGAERAAVNAPIQGTSADIIKRAMARMCPALEAEGLGKVRMLMQVHDELVFEVPEADVARASEVIRHVMAGAAEPAVKLSVPLGVDIGTGPNWGAAH